jgi:hypothetical protein
MEFNQVCERTCDKDLRAMTWLEWASCQNCHDGETVGVLEVQQREVEPPLDSSDPQN